MFKSQKNVFWQALFVTILIFGIGVVAGIILEDWRTGNIDVLYQQSELDLMDVRIQTDIYSTGTFNCDKAVRENINFAERIYNEAKLLDRYEQASTLKEDIKARHKKYDLLRANLFLNSIKIKEKCNSSYYDVVYLYKYNNPSLNVKAKQNIFSKLLLELKSRRGNEILLIPMAGDNNLASIDIIKDKYGIVDEDLPVILINGKIKITELETIDELIKNFE